MDYRDLYHHQTYYPYRANELFRQADHERVAQVTSSGQRRLRFYYPAMVSFGRWLIASGYHLQKRYGEICELPATTSRPARRNA